MKLAVSYLRPKYVISETVSFHELSLKKAGCGLICTAPWKKSNISIEDSLHGNF